MKLTPKNTDNFLQKMDYLNGGNVERIDVVLASDAAEAPFSWIDVYAYPEDSETTYKIRLLEPMAFNFKANASDDYFELSGERPVLDIVWHEQHVRLAVQSAGTDATHSHFWVDAAGIDVSIVVL